MQSATGTAAGNCLLIKKIMGSCLLCDVAVIHHSTTPVLQSAHGKNN
jgi:hypothetical protein